MALHETCRQPFGPFQTLLTDSLQDKPALDWPCRAECLLRANLVLMLLLLLLLLSVCFGHGGGSSRGMHSHSIARGGAHEPIVRACAHMCMTYTRARARADIDGRHWPLPGDNAGMKKWPSQRDLSNLLAASNCGIELKTLF